MEHNLPINDVDHAWSQEVTIKEPEGEVRLTVWFGRCTCGERFSAMTPEAVVRQYLDHTR